MLKIKSKSVYRSVKATVIREKKLYIHQSHSGKHIKIVTLNKSGFRRGLGGSFKKQGGDDVSFSIDRVSHRFLRKNFPELFLLMPKLTRLFLFLM